MPKNPIPPPLAAQNKSEFCSRLQIRISPSAVTISICTSHRSAVNPQPCMKYPCPPHNRNPPNPTVGECPNGKNNPRGVRYSCASWTVFPGPKLINLVVSSYSNPGLTCFISINISSFCKC